MGDGIVAIPVKVPSPDRIAGTDSPDERRQDVPDRNVGKLLTQMEPPRRQERLSKVDRVHHTESPTEDVDKNMPAIATPG